ncbi:hypothetical protein SADUNF_Sadunf05G0097900 [Salix dunnii]|uniref:Tetratricopeptide SHNi-TPR domain-containing protein n=1 Tax=Salix dunnii TaxID=1413687 RepID=A0A835K7M8_9ROSI|nr:hypothetical protein SADUNF_Sadunf05G0097900 [Salix dunnii]
MASESSVTAPKAAPIETQASVEATIKESTTTSSQGGAADSTCNDDNNGETSDPRKSLDFAVVLSEKGTDALKENDFSEAVECFSRALEIRVLHHGELALECVNAYYHYGRALLYKAQEEADPLAMVTEKNSASKQDDNKDGASRNAVNGESSSASVSSNVEEGGGSNHPEGEADGVQYFVAQNVIGLSISPWFGDCSFKDKSTCIDWDLIFLLPLMLKELQPSGGKDKEEEEDEGIDDEDLAEADEEESDLDLAWKMLDVARAISEKHLDDTMDKVDILSALAEVALERGLDYQKALSILERLVEPDSRHLAELYPYQVCKARLQRLIEEVKISTESATSSAVSELDEGVQRSSNVQADKSVTDKEAEIETLTGWSAELEKKHEDLQQMVLNPKSIIAEIIGMVSDKEKGGEKSASPNLMSSSQLGIAYSSRSYDPPAISTGHTNGVVGVTDLGVAGRGVKRVLMSTGLVGSSSAVKKPTPDPSSDKGDGKT